MLEPESSCLTCNSQENGTKLVNITNSDSNTISVVLRKHFWFTDNDFHHAKICQTCWDKINDFHQFYVAAQDLYHSRLTSQVISYDPDFEELVPNLSEFCDDDVINEIELVQNSDDATESDNSADREDDDQIGQREKRGGNKPRVLRQLDEDYMRGHVKYICEPCGQESETFAGFLNHSVKAHNVQTAFVTCCGNKYYDKHRLYEHVQFVKNPDVFRCDLCQKSYTRKEGLQTHRKAFHTESNFPCDWCQKSFVTKYLLNVHKQDHIGGEEKGNTQLACEHCSKNFKTQENLDKHMKQWHTKTPAYTCDICSKFFSQKSWYLKHMLKHDSPQGLKRQCDICSKWLKDSKSLFCHVQNHHAAKVHQDGGATCKTCGHESPNTASLKLHIYRKHRKVQKANPQKCPICAKIFSWKASMRKHMKDQHPNDSQEQIPSSSASTA